MNKVTAIMLSAIPSGVLAASSMVTPGSILSRVKSDGAVKALSDLHNLKDWPVIMNGISSGDDDWLSVYSAIKPLADGEVGEDLSKSIFGALPKNPLRVLPILSAHHHSVSDVCTFSFEAESPPGGIKAYLDRLDKSLEEAKGRSELRMARLCRLGIKVTRKRYGSGPDY